MKARAIAAVAAAVLFSGCGPAFRTTPPTLTSGNVVPSTRTKCTWKIVPNDRQVREGGLLNGIAAIGSKNAWAVGAHGAGLTTIEHWNGSKWKLTPSMNPSSSLNAFLGVAGSSSSDVWAVGEYSNAKATIEPLAEHWNGSKWSLSKAPMLAGNGGYFSSVVALAKNDAWAVGTLNGTNARQTLAAHWNGKSWSVVKTPNVTSNDDYLASVAARGTNDVWAGGGYNNGTTGSSLGFTLHWDGKKWSVVKIDPLKTLYYPIASVAVAPGSSTIFAIGTYADEKRKQYREYAEQLGKSRWGLLNPIDSHYYYYASQGTFLNGSAASSSNLAIGVGYYLNGLTKTFAMVWDGSRWTVSLTPNVANDNSFLNAASAIPGTKSIWAAGGFSQGSKAGPLIEHGDCM